MLRTQEDTPISWVALDCAVTVQIVMHVNSNKVYLLICTYENSMFQKTGLVTSYWYSGRNFGENAQLKSILLIVK